MWRGNIRSTFIKTLRLSCIQRSIHVCGYIIWPLPILWRSVVATYSAICNTVCIHLHSRKCTCRPLTFSIWCRSRSWQRVSCGCFLCRSLSVGFFLYLRGCLRLPGQCLVQKSQMSLPCHHMLATRFMNSSMIYICQAILIIPISSHLHSLNSPHGPFL